MSPKMREPVFLICLLLNINIFYLFAIQSLGIDRINSIYIFNQSVSHQYKTLHVHINRYNSFVPTSYVLKKKKIDKSFSNTTSTLTLIL